MRSSCSCSPPGRPRPLRGGALLATFIALLTIACRRDGGEISTATPPVEPAAQGRSAPPPERTAAPIADRLHRGLDVSGHSGRVDWVTVRSEGQSFAFTKATEGVDLKDPAFDDNWRAMKAAGIVRGAYHFYVTEDDPEAQARFFIDTVTLEPGDLAPVVDVELIGHGTEPGLAGRLRAWLARVEGHYGVAPIIYTRASFWNEHLDDGFGRYPLWVAEYEVAAPTLPIGWSDWHLWQYRGDVEHPGVEKGVDLSRVRREAPDLAALVVPQPGR